MSDAARDKNNDNETLGSAFLVYKPVRLDQLVYEIAQAMNWRKEPVLSAGGDPNIVDASEPIDVFIDRTDVDDNIFITAVAAHTPDPLWTHPDLPTTTPTPLPDISLEDLHTRVASGKGLTSDEQSAAIAALLKEWHDRTTT